MIIVPREAAIEAVKPDLGSVANRNQLGLRCLSGCAFCIVYYCVVRNRAMEQSVNIKLGKSPTETHEMLRTAHGDETLSRAQTFP